MRTVGTSNPVFITTNFGDTSAVGTADILALNLFEAAFPDV